MLFHRFKLAFLSAASIQWFFFLLFLVGGAAIKLAVPLQSDGDPGRGDVEWSVAIAIDATRIMRSVGRRGPGKAISQPEATR